MDVFDLIACGATLIIPIKSVFTPQRTNVTILPLKGERRGGLYEEGNCKVGCSDTD